MAANSSKRWFFILPNMNTAYGDRKVKIDYGKFEALKMR